MKCRIIWAFTVCNSTHLGVSGPKRVKNTDTTKQDSLPSKHVDADHNRPASEIPISRPLAGGPIVARDCLQAGFRYLRQNMQF